MLNLIERLINFLKKIIMNQQPLSTCHFKVEWGGTRIGATEVTGLSLELEQIEYREGASPEYSPQISPGQQKNNRIIIKRGIVQGDNQYFEWINTVRLNTIERRDLTISLLNQNHEPVVSWRIKNAFPVKLNWSDLNANANEAAIESLEIVHEGMTVLNE